MPIFECYITKQERLDFFDFIKKNEGNLILKKDYKEPKYLVIKNREEFEYYVYKKGKPMYYLISDRFTFEPLVFVDIEYDKKGIEYFIYQRKGGPYINLDFFVGYPDDATVQYPITVVEAYARFIHYDSTDEFRLPDEAREYYKMLVKYLKSRCFIVRKNGRRYYISKQLKDKIIIKE